MTFDLNQDPKYDAGLVCGGTLEIFVERLCLRPILYFLERSRGRSLYQVARLAGFDVTVIDDREAFANRERFPEAHQVSRGFRKGCRTAHAQRLLVIVIVTRGHRDDMRMLPGPCNASAPTSA